MHHLTIFGAGEQLSLNNLLRTEAFRANQFEGFIPSFREQNGLVVLEAENASQVSPRNGKNWLAQTGLTDYTGTGYLKASPDIGTLSASTNAETGAELQYSFYINTLGTYYLWLRGYAPDGAGDSVYVGLGENSVSGGQLLAGNSYLTGFPPRSWAWANRGVWQQV